MNDLESFSSVPCSFDLKHFSNMDDGTVSNIITIEYRAERFETMKAYTFRVYSSAPPIALEGEGHPSGTEHVLARVLRY